MMLAEALVGMAVASTVAITDVTVVDPARATAQANQTVVVAGGRIVTVGASAKTPVPVGAERIEGRGRFLIPGLCDMHVHSGAYESGRRMAALLVANGITCARDMGSPLDDVLRLRDEIRSGGLGPEMVVAGPLLETSLPPALAANPMLLAVGTALDARAAVRRLQARGVDLIKVDSSLTRDAYFAIARECRSRRVPFAGHVPPAVTAEEASRAGQASIEHLGGHHLGVLLSCSRREAPLVDAARRIMNTAIREAWAGREPDSLAPLRVGFTRPVLESFDPRRAAALFARFKQRRTWQTPTLVTLQRSWQAEATALTPADVLAGEELMRKSRELVRMMRDAGVGLLAGTDLPMNGAESPLGQELAALVTAGLTPAEALSSATTSAAHFLGWRDAGVVAAGSRADLVLLEADPLQDVANVRKIAAVVLRGRVLRAEELARIRAEGVR